MLGRSTDVGILLVLLSDVYVKEKLENTITFGDKSRLGRGGMTAKVKAVVYASQVVITSGFVGDNIIKVLGGQDIGTLFQSEAHAFTPSGELNAREMTRESSSLIQLSDGFISEKMSSPQGVLFVIFESRPEALVQV
ncbi:putative glutamate-5-semialdehyde dehydrogenase [Helianthus anomalus]